MAAVTGAINSTDQAAEQANPNLVQNQTASAIPAVAATAAAAQAGISMTAASAIVAPAASYPLSPVPRPLHQINFHAIQSDPMEMDPNVKSLWENLQKSTAAQFNKIRYLPPETLCERFVKILCPMMTAVYVEREKKLLHANFVGEGLTQRGIVASQAPHPRELLVFWRAIYESGATIIDLTTVEDRYTGITPYCPECPISDLDQSKSFGSISVILRNFDVLFFEEIYTYQLKDETTGKEKLIKRHHWLNWYDGTAISVELLCTLVKRLEGIYSENPKGLLWIHCIAGVGRTGTLVTALILKEKIDRGEINKGNLRSSLNEIILKLREQRGTNFVSTLQQFHLLVSYAEALLDGAPSVAHAIARPVAAMAAPAATAQAGISMAAASTVAAMAAPASIAAAPLVIPPAAAAAGRG